MTAFHSIFFRFSPATNIHHLFPGNFTVLTATFEFKRRVGYYLLQVYLPCAILVMLSWIAFWMDKRDTGNRLTVMGILPCPK